MALVAAGPGKYVKEAHESSLVGMAFMISNTPRGRVSARYRWVSFCFADPDQNSCMLIQ